MVSLNKLLGGVLIAASILYFVNQAFPTIQQKGLEKMSDQPQPKKSIIDIVRNRGTASAQGVVRNG